MSHVRRKPSRYPVKTVKKKKNNINWLAIIILVLIFLGVIAGIIFVALSSP